MHPQEGVVYYKYLVFRAVLMSARPKLCIGRETVPGMTNKMGCWQVEEHNRMMDVELEEDDLPFTQVGDGVPVSTLLRVLAANLLALLRDAHLRSVDNRRLPWRRVCDLVWQVLVADDPGTDDGCAAEPAAAS